MIIKITPETEEEMDRIKEVEHHNVREFFIFGTKKDPDGDVVDFHDWTGQYRYLIGSLAYFQNKLMTDESSKSSNKQEIVIKPETHDSIAETKTGLTKTGETGPITQVIDAKELTDMMKKNSNVVKFPGKKSEPEVVEAEVIEPEVIEPEEPEVIEPEGEKTEE